jgi:outer membrane biosynthesis protein TonB
LKEGFIMATTKKTTAKTAPAKTAPVKEEPVKKTVATTAKKAEPAKTETVKVETVKKAEPVKKAPVKKVAPKKVAPKKPVPVETKVNFFVEYAGAQVPVEEVIKNVKATYGKDAKEISIYLKPEESKAYFVADGNAEEMDVFFC